MTAFTLRPIEEMETIAHGVLRRAGAELGVRSFGMQVLELPGGFEHYPEHDHRDDGMEEVYLVLHGSADVDVDGERIPLDADRMVRVDAGARRKVLPGPDGARVLVVGAIPGRAYERPPEFRLGAPDPAEAAR